MFTGENCPKDNVNLAHGNAMGTMSRNIKTLKEFLKKVFEEKSVNFKSGLDILQCSIRNQKL